MRSHSPTSEALPSAERTREELVRRLEQVLAEGDSGSGPKPEAEKPKAKAKVGRFTLVRKLGRGGMGDVFYARDERLGREVAVKLLRTKDDPINHARFERGAKAMASLSHRNVVQLHEIGDLDGLPYIVMEYVDGVTLDTWLAEKPRALTEILTTFIEAGSGLLAAHDLGLVHRDFKPGNVMLARDGRVLVTDFGLARGEPSTSEEDLSRELRVAGLLTGTPAYMAPEQFAGDEVDARCDQFGFCVALFEAVYGRRPYKAANVQALAALVHSGEPEFPPGARVPRWLRRTLERGLAVRPDDRWPSMRELLDVLGRRRWLRWSGR